MSFHTLWITQRQFQILRRFYKAKAAKAGRTLSWETSPVSGNWNQTVWRI